jgi:nitroimidazol reductase NimA-like FMN-containing flavoprotein (pyridoxamine 5'-phosphate oxidase superfamily)
MTAPAFFVNDSRRTDYAWDDWDAVRAFLDDQVVCRIAVNDGDWPYVVAQTYLFDGTAFALHFSRSGKLAERLRADTRCTIEVSQAVSLLKAPYANNTSCEYRSVVARCVASIAEIDLDAIEAQQHAALEKFRPERDYQPIDRDRATRRIVALRASVVQLSAKKRILAEGGNPAGIDYAAYPFPPPAALSSLPPEAFEPRFDASGRRLSSTP